MLRKLILTISVVIISTAAGWSAEYADSNQQKSHTVQTPPLNPLEININGQNQAITLQQAFAFHGHTCPAMTTAYRALQHGIQALYGDTVPSRQDLLVISLTPAGGAKDLLDLLMKGNDVNSKTWAPPGMVNDLDGFKIMIIKKSSSEAVDVKINPANFPADYFQLKEKARNNTITTEEKGRLNNYLKKILIGSATTPADLLFGAAKPYKLIFWGNVESGEMDRHIRNMRRAEKAKQLLEEKKGAH